MAPTLGREGQALAETAVVLPVLVMMALLALWLQDFHLSGLQAQEAARCLAWKGPTTPEKAKAEAARSLGGIRDARVEEARQATGAVRDFGMGAEEPLLGGWVGRTLGTSKGEAVISLEAPPWGGERARRAATHVVDLGRPPKKGSKALDRWVRERIGAKAPPEPEGGKTW